MKGGGLKEFSRQDIPCFEGSDKEQTFFTTEERQWLVLRILESIRAKPSDVNSLPGLDLLEGQPIGLYTTSKHLRWQVCHKLTNIIS